MLIRLTPDNISEYWEYLAWAIEKSLPPFVGTHVDRMNNILQSALSGTIDIWTTTEDVNGKNTITSVIVTNFLFDDVSQTKSMLIYSLYGIDTIDGEVKIKKESWVTGLTGLLKYAKKAGAYRVIAYTDNPAIIALSKRSGAEAKYTFISYPLSEYDYD